LHATAEAARGLLDAMPGGGAASRRAADTYADTSDRLLDWLLRHLEDEEDLIVPTILDRTEAVIGLW